MIDFGTHGAKTQKKAEKRSVGGAFSRDCSGSYFVSVAAKSPSYHNDVINFIPNYLFHLIAPIFHLYQVIHD